jgi:hypothetical protein
MLGSGPRPSGLGAALAFCWCSNLAQATLGIPADYSLARARHAAITAKVRRLDPPPP